MATEENHIALANKNHQTLEYLLLDETSHPEWIATISFYKALHVVEAVFSNDSNVRSRTNHNSRLDELKARSVYHPIFKHYRVLWQASTVARYLYDQSTSCGYSRFTDYLPAKDVRKKLVKRRLRSVEQHCKKFLSEKGKNALKVFPSN